MGGLLHWYQCVSGKTTPKGCHDLLDLISGLRNLSHSDKVKHEFLRNSCHTIYSVFLLAMFFVVQNCKFFPNSLIVLIMR